MFGRELPLVGSYTNTLLSPVTSVIVQYILLLRLRQIQVRRHLSPRLHGPRNLVEVSVADTSVQFVIRDPS